MSGGRFTAELLAVLEEALTLHEQGELCRGGLLRQEWAEKAASLVARATGPKRQIDQMRAVSTNPATYLQLGKEL